MDQSILSVTATSPCDWKYISEGGATIVFSYVGPNAQFARRVLRLRKASSPSLIPVDAPQEPDDPSIAFQQTIMERLIPAIHLPKLDTVHLDPVWLETFSLYHNDERPVGRKADSFVDVARTKGVLATDLVGGEAIAVEIKPKWSFLPNPTFLSNDTRSIKTRTCRFCMHGHVKLSEGETVAQGYCPLDLFSGKEPRIRAAIDALYDAWVLNKGEANNLKVFVHGQHIISSERYKVLENPKNLSETELRQALTEAIARLLLNTPVLQILNDLQRTLDILDIEGLAQLWAQVHPSVPIGDGVPQPTLTEWSAFLDIYLKDSSYEREKPRIEDLRHYLLAYLLASTFKDCSIMVRLDLIRIDDPLRTIDPQRVTVIDLDPKGMDRMKKWLDQDQNIVTAYAQIEPAFRKHCVDVLAN